MKPVSGDSHKSLLSRKSAGLIAPYYSNKVAYFEPESFACKWGKPPSFFPDLVFASS
jgi:hypothetical protein